MNGTAAEFDEITADLDATTAAWVAAGYHFDGPEFEAREAVFARLKEWNKAREQWTTGVVKRSRLISES